MGYPTIQNSRISIGMARHSATLHFWQPPRKRKGRMEQRAAVRLSTLQSLKVKEIETDPTILYDDEALPIFAVKK
jgi:hypothetical protein